MDEIQSARWTIKLITHILEMTSMTFELLFTLHQAKITLDKPIRKYMSVMYCWLCNNRIMLSHINKLPAHQNGKQINCMYIHVPVFVVYRQYIVYRLLAYVGMTHNNYLKANF